MKICVVGYGYVGKAMVAAFEQGENIDYDIVDPAYEEYNNPLMDVMAVSYTHLTLPTKRIV